MESMNFSKYTSHLYAKPSFLTGMGRVFDIGGQMNAFNMSESPAQADAKALANDWKAVGSDIQSALNKYGKTE